MKFEEFNLSEPLMRAIRKQGFVEPTPVQEQAIPAALQGKDIIGTAQTGTGKTVAFLLPSMEHLTKGVATKKPRMVVLAPTRELTVQITEEARDLARFTSLRIVAIYGGVSIRTRTECSTWDFFPTSRRSWGGCQSNGRHCSSRQRCQDQSRG